MHTIYALVDPRTDRIRYIGRTTNNPNVRLQNHLSTAGKNNTNQLKTDWINQLRQLNLKPIAIVLENTTDEDAETAELEWIKKGEQLGWELLNIRDCTINFKEHKKRQKILKLRRKQPIVESSIRPLPHRQPHYWEPIVAQWFDEHPEAKHGRPHGISDLARRMSAHVYDGNESYYRNFKSHAAKLFHAYRSQHEHAP